MRATGQAPQTDSDREAAQNTGTRERARLGFVFHTRAQRVAEAGYPLFQGALQLRLLILGFLELGEDSGQEVLKAGQ